jgi:hypothetical protein
MPHLLGMETHQVHEGFIAEQQRRQRIHAVNPTQGLQPIAQEGLHTRHPRTLKRLALDAFHQVEDSQLPPELEEVIQQRPCLQAIHAIDHVLAVQASCHPRLIAVGRLPTQPFRQMLRPGVAALSPGAPSSLACLSALEESSPLINGCAYIGTSVRGSLMGRLTISRQVRMVRRSFDSGLTPAAMGR